MELHEVCFAIFLSGSLPFPCSLSLSVCGKTDRLWLVSILSGVSTASKKHKAELFREKSCVVSTNFYSTRTSHSSSMHILIILRTNDLKNKRLNGFERLFFSLKLVWSCQLFPTTRYQKDMKLLNISIEFHLFSVHRRGQRSIHYTVVNAWIQRTSFEHFCFFSSFRRIQRCWTFFWIYT